MNKNIKTKKINKWFYLLLSLLIFWHGFIFYHSLMPGSVSSMQSGVIVDAIEPVVTVIAPNIAKDTLTLLVRKGAHLSEFFVLGVLLFLVYRFKFKNWLLIIIVLGHGLIIASIDETIQLFTPNRAGLITDVLIDFTGVLIASLLLFSISKIRKKLR